MRDLNGVGRRRRWLDYQHEIGLRHHRIKKKADRRCAVDRHRAVSAFVSGDLPVTTTLRPFLANYGRSPEDVEKTQLTLWSYLYIKDGDF